MDFTYLVAAVLSLLIGMIGSVFFVLAGGQSYRKLLVSTAAVAVVVDFAILLDWRRIEEITVAFLLTDLAFFASYGLLGCALGALPVLGGRRLYRWSNRPNV